MSWTDPGREAWKDFYSNLERPKSGILADLCARAEAQVLRLSMLYALLDGTNQISPTHLQAALAFWRYASDSAKWIFGQKTGNRLADRILGALQRRATKQMSRAEIQNDVCQRNQTKAQIDEALSVLRDGDLVSMRLERSTVARKPAEIWQLK